jgi:hypothetical protein
MRFTPAEIDGQLQQLYLSTSSSSADLATGSNLLNDSTLSAALAPILRNIAASKQQDAFTKQLKTFIAAKEAEIEDICKAHYQEFVASTDKLLKVRQGTVSLKDRVAGLNEDIQSKGGQVAQKASPAKLRRQFSTLARNACCWTTSELQRISTRPSTRSRPACACWTSPPRLPP